MALFDNGLMNVGNYEQGFTNPYPNLSGPLGGGPGYVPPTQQQLDYWKTNPGQMDEGTGGGNPYMANNPYTTAQTNSQDIGSQMRDLYSQGYSGGQLAAKAQQMGISPQQFAQATGLSMDVVNQAYGGASAYQGGIGAADRNVAGSAGFVNPNASGTDSVAGLYQSLLGRAPDAEGLAYWNQQLASGKSINDIANAFKQTPEYLQRQQQPQVRPNPSTQPNTNPYGITTANPFASTNNPYIQASQQTALGNLAGAQTATAANRVNQQTPYGSLQYTQTGTDAQGNPIWSANQTLSPQLQALTQQSLSGLQSSLSNPAYGINPGETYSNAILQRLQPQQQQAQSRLETQLANQGIMPGSEAYNRARTQLSQQQNDQLTSAIVGGMQTGLQANTAQNQTAANIKSLATPGYVNPYSQAATSGPDYTGAFATSQAADIAAQNAALARQSNLTSGLFNLGTAGVLGSGGLTGLASAIPGAYNWLSNLSGGTPSYIGPSYGVNPSFSNSIFDTISYD